MVVTRSITAFAKQHEEVLLFGGVGAVGTVINMLLLWALTTAGMHYLAASAIATEAAIIANFTGNQFITFSHVSNGLSVTQQFLSFQLISLSTIAGTMAVLWGLTTAFGKSLLLLWNLIAIGTMFFVNYGLNASVTWRKGTTGLILILLCVTTGVAIAAPAPNATTVNEVNNTTESTTNVTSNTTDDTTAGNNTNDTNETAGTNHTTVNKTDDNEREEDNTTQTGTNATSNTTESNTTDNTTAGNSTNGTTNTTDDVNETTTENETAVEDTTSVVRITSTPSGATGTINGTGFITPANVTVENGLHNVLLSRTGYKNLKETVNITEDTNLSYVLNEAIPYVLEGQSVTFTANTTGNVTWTVGNETVRSDESFTWTPSIFFTQDTKNATITPNTGETRTVTVRDVANPYFSSNNGRTVFHVLTNNAVDTYRNVTVLFVNGDRQRNLTLQGSNGGDRTDWTTRISLRPGTTYARTVYLTADTTRRFDLGTARGQYKQPPEQEEKEGGGGAGGSSDYTVTQDKSLPTLVSAFFSENTIDIGDTVNLTVDAKNFNGGVTRVEAVIGLPDGSYEMKELNRTEGSEEYGTWTASVTASTSGEYTLQKVNMWSGDDSFTESVPDRTFYAGGETEERNLELVYTTLNRSDASVGEPVTLTLDAADSDGVDRVSARINTSNGESYTVPLNVTAGSPQYGTWTGIVTPLQGGVHTVEEILLHQGNRSKGYELENRRFYVDEPPAMNTSVRNASLQTANMDGPFSPTILAVGLVALTVTAWISARRLHNFLDPA